MKRIRALLAKELLLETRQQYSFYGLLLYIGTTLFVLFMAIDQPDAATWNGLFWVNLLFICINAVAKSFLQESRARMLYFFAGRSDGKGRTFYWPGTAGGYQS
jgi:heme exporter protein B